jgi:hypothetical protein
MPTSKKGGASGPRIPVSWGSAKRKVNGKQVTVPLVSLVQESVFKISGLKEYKFATSLKLIKDKKGRQRIAAQGITRSASRYALAWMGDLSLKSKGKVWHRIPVPPGISLAKVAKQLQAGKRVVEVKWPSTMIGRAALLKNPNKGKGSKK